MRVGTAERIVIKLIDTTAKPDHMASESESSLSEGHILLGGESPN